MLCSLQDYFLNNAARRKSHERENTVVCQVLQFSQFHNSEKNSLFYKERKKKLLMTRLHFTWRPWVKLLHVLANCRRRKFRRSAANKVFRRAWLATSGVRVRSIYAMLRLSLF